MTADIKVVQLPQNDPQTLKNFLEEISKGGTRPLLYVGYAEDGHPVLHTAQMTWREIAHIKLILDMHFIRDYLGILDQE